MGFTRSDLFDTLDLVDDLDDLELLLLLLLVVVVRMSLSSVRSSMLLGISSFFSSGFSFDGSAKYSNNKSVDVPSICDTVGFTDIY
jgi:hypothetical protein